MNEEFKKIAKSLGVVLPSCLFTIGSANAATTMPTRNSDVPSVCVKMNKGNDVISHMMANAVNYSSDRYSPDHTDTHTDVGGNHTDSHSNYDHQDRHSNRDAQNSTRRIRNEDGSYSNVPYCAPHSNSHTNRDGYNRHTNSGNRSHSDRHTNRNSSYDCN